MAAEPYMSALANYPRITPFLWFDNNAEEAVEFYLSIFRNSHRLDQPSSTEDGSQPKAKPMTLGFELDGQKFTALNGGPAHKFTEAISLWCVATRKTKWITTGPSSRRAARRFSAVGSKTNSASAGKLCPLACPN